MGCMVRLYAIVANEGYSGDILEEETGCMNDDMI